MKVLFLSKRRPMGRDLLTSPYGRFYYLPRLLAQKGHLVTVALCAYKKESGEIKNSLSDNIKFCSENIFRYYQKVCELVDLERPDWIVGFSDIYYGILAQHLATRYGCKSLIDAYDNYESYIPWCKPLHYLWRRALAKSDVVTAPGPELLKLMNKSRKGKPSRIISMAADPIGFKPMDKIECRNKLNLPIDKKLIGFCGSIHPSRDIQILFRAFEKIRYINNDIELVLSGRKATSVSIPEGVRWLGYLPDDLIPSLLNSMDVLAITNKPTVFGNFSYPVKLYEAMCCQVPVVASATLSTEWILAKFPHALVEPDNVNELIKKLRDALSGKDRIDYSEKEGWENECCQLEELLMTFKTMS